MMDATFFLRALLPGFSGRDVCPFCDLFNSLTLSFLFLFFLRLYFGVGFAQSV